MATVQSILDKKGGAVVSMVADASVLDAARVMNDRSVGGVVVTDGANMVGIFTERDILRRVVAEQRDPAKVPLRDVMTSPVASCRPETKLDECISVMTKNRIRHMPVVNDEGVCGIVTSGDIMAHQVSEHETTIEYLNSYMFDLR